MAKNLKILVTGATGKQWGAVAHRLIEKGHHVRAYTRKPDSDAAKKLAQAGAEIVTGSLEDRAALDKAFAGVDAAFGMGTPFEAGEAAEVKQGVTLADAAKAAGAYLVFTSVASGNRHTGIPHFESKYEVEQHIAKLGIPAAILAPVYFMENAFFSLDQLKKGVYASPLNPTKKLAQIAVADIGDFAVLALENRERFVGKRYDLAGDDLSGQETVNLLSKITGKSFSYFQVPMANIRQMSDDMAIMYEWFDRVGYQLDIAALKRDFPEVRWHTFESWAKTQDWKTLLA
jgi:uncharacterized protein YbjT (DUF2867 family)